MIKIPIIDTHLHLWDVDKLQYAWLNDLPAINRSFLLGDYQEQTAHLLIEKMVFVQCEVDPKQALQEVAWVTQQAAIDSRVKGIVAWAPLEKGEAAREDLAALSQFPLVKGIRRIIQFEEDPTFCLKPDFIRGVQLLSEFNMSFDLCIKGDEQFCNTLELVKQCPDVSFILDHIGKPFIKEKILNPWSQDIAQLAALPNTYCKVSGLISEADSDNGSLQDYRPYLDCVFNHFGFDRVMFGGDWPVCTLGCTYSQWIQTLWQAVSHCTDKQQENLFYNNAAKFYRL
ncbi:MAG: amidohydrolase family protein [Phycisphaeraceae bacterium]|nr:amidohydrolase family protein [Phycisphaeraceae bacterium]